MTVVHQATKILQVTLAETFRRGYYWFHGGPMPLQAYHALIRYEETKKFPREVLAFTECGQKPRAFEQGTRLALSSMG